MALDTPNGTLMSDLLWGGCIGGWGSRQRQTHTPTHTHTHSVRRDTQGGLNFGQ